MAFTEEQKRYRNDFIMLTLFAVFGIMVGIFLYEYTDFFTALKAEEPVFGKTEFSFKELLYLYYDEIKIALLVFLAGFTLFSPIVSGTVLLYKGFLCGFSMLYYGICYQNQAINAKGFKLMTFVLVSELVIYVIIGAKAMAFGGSLKYAAPDLISTLKHKFAKKYILTFLIMAAFTAILSAVKYFIPNM
ncbi:MAG: hypothetical protein E7591_09080 [Ruminococcaceae bacterium]|nr:hypothetical protein [Oscillospiraceae bacterium]